ncbi:TRAP transporter substrate-binding protein [Oceanibacterium hippocampi]|uniref:Lactate-binding periplasmic protein n=1 Tax=Oceanibacterium hippocampi TaxID=745714 RepID=A0A1Y5TXR6_9PROT|nr:TRAP transporter substrate-binding protein [Oceanibacterium hippocampi]SLN70996.1 Lactate-binding periplasmic protein precursor [Oceanibacterium hippocampi]
MAMKKYLLPVLSAIGLLGLSGAASAETVLTVSRWVPAGHLMSHAMLDWCGKVKDATSGRVSCEMLPKGVAPPAQTFDAVRDGLADMSFGVHGYTPGRYTLTGLAELPFLGETATATSVAYQRIYEKHLAKFDEHRGLKVITVFTHGPGVIFNTQKPIATVADMQGLKFRTGGGTINRISNALGANVTLKPATESYELLSSGVMDGVFFPNESVRTFKLEKLIKYATTFPGGLYNTSFAFVMNADTWKGIPEQDQKIIDGLSGEAAARLFGGYWDKGDSESAELQHEVGIELTRADEAFVAEVKDLTKDIETDWIERAGKAGLENPAAVLAEFRADIAKLSD